MGVLSSVIPGLREIRPNLAGGYLWLLCAYLGLRPLVDSRHDGLLDGRTFALAEDVDRLVGGMGDLGRLAAVTALAYAVGLMAEEIRETPFTFGFQIDAQLPRLLTVAHSIRRVVATDEPDESLSPEEEALDIAVADYVRSGFWAESRTHTVHDLIEVLAGRGRDGIAPAKIQLEANLTQRLAEMLRPGGSVHPSMIGGLMRMLRDWRNKNDTSPIGGSAGLRSRIQALELSAGRMAAANPAIENSIIRRFSEARTRRAVSLPGIVLILIVAVRYNWYIDPIWDSTSTAPGVWFIVPQLILFPIVCYMWWHATRGRDLLTEISHAEALLGREGEVSSRSAAGASSER